MFYSHEILSNSQYGVATIWLVATVGRGGQRKLTKKAIQEVNVPKACEKILDPGAPLALRLQGSLLYGVSRVFAQQCNYVLTDVEKTQSDMMTFFRVMQTSETDPQAGKTKRQNIILQDDPSFDPMSMLPNLDLLNWDKELLLLPSQGSASKFSQMTPLGGASQCSFSSGRNSVLNININLELPPSSHSAASCRIPSDFGRQSPLFGKSIHDPDNMPDFRPFDNEEFVPISGIGLDFDADGNLVEVLDQEPELPPLHGQEEFEEQLPETQIIQTREIEEQRVPLVEDGSMLDFAEPALPDAAAFPTRKSAKKPTLSDPPTSETTETDQASAKMIRTRRTKHQTMLDETLRISRDEFRDWSENYVNNMDTSRKCHKATTLTQARKNAQAFLYGNGIADVGVYRGAADFVHPLAVDFSGNPLKARLQGQEPDEVEAEVKKRGRRRKSDEAFEGDDNLEQGKRHSRQRVEDEAELGRGEDNDGNGYVMFDDHSIPEIGMDAAPPMEDRHSSSVMPWSRPGSVVPGSSVRGSAQKARLAPSPSFGPGSIIGPINRHSDPAEPLFGQDDFGSHDSSFNFGGPAGALDFGRDSNTQVSTQGLDVASQDFLGYVTDQASKRGTKRAQDREKTRRWIEFEDLADPHTHTKAVAAQAFLHVLSLATKKTVSVEQDGAQKMEPFGAIRIGVDVMSDDDKSNTGSEQAESEDELA